MKLCILTRKREGMQETVKYIPPELLEDTVLVCPKGEKHPYQKVYQPDSVTNYSQKMQWLLYDAFPNEEKIIMMDDDLYFNEYQPNGKLMVIDPKTQQDSLRLMWKNLLSIMDHYALCGIHPRMLFNHAKPHIELNSKIVTVQGINRSKIPVGLKIDQFPILSDVVLNCTLLSRGIGNARITTHAVAWKDSQAAGGCDYRTVQMQKDATAYIAEKFGPFAKQVIRTPKKVVWLPNEDGSNSRYDLNVRWKDLYEHGRRKFGNQYERTADPLDPGTLQYSYAEGYQKAVSAMES